MMIDLARQDSAAPMKQVLFTIPGVGAPVHGFALMAVVAFYLGLRLARRRSRREGLDPDLIEDMAPWIMLGGLIGARLLFVAEYWGEKVASLGGVFRVWEGGIVFYGCVLGAVVALLLFRAFRTFPLLATLDVLAPSLALGIAIGRVGCFLNGCCYGDRCDIPWLAVRFPPNSPPWLAEEAQGVIPAAAPASLPLHPTQLYSSLNGLVLLALLSAYYPLRRRNGEVFGLFLLTYPILRFLVEALRDDEKALITGLTIAQATSLFVLAFGLLYWALLSHRPEGRWRNR